MYSACRGIARVLAVALGAVGAARAAPAPEALPIAGEIRLSAEALGARVQHAGPEGLAAPAGPACTVAVGEQARDAWLATSRRLFRGAPGAPKLLVELRAVHGEFALSASGWKAAVAHDLVVSDAAGLELARWTLRGESPILGADAPAIPRAFARAASDVTASFARGLSDVPGVAAWLAGHAVSPPASTRQRLRSAPARGGFAAFAEGAFGIPPRDERRDFAWAARAGVSAGRARAALTAALGLSRWGMPFAASPPFGAAEEGQLSLTAVDLDVGVALRPARHLELSAGAGLSWVVGEARVAYALDFGSPADRVLTIEELRSVGTIYAAAHYVLPLSPGVRLRVGLEARARPGPTFRYDALRTEVRAQDAPLRLLVGLELPLGRPTAEARLVATRR